MRAKNMVVEELHYDDDDSSLDSESGDSEASEVSDANWQHEHEPGVDYESDCPYVESWGVS